MALTDRVGRLDLRTRSQEISSHADRVRRHCNDADPQEPPLTPPRQALKCPLSQLERYAGWLAKDYVSVAGPGRRARVKPWTSDMKRHCCVLGEIRALLGGSGIDAHDGVDS